VFPLNIAMSEQQTVLSGYLFDSARLVDSRADIIVASVDVDKKRSLEIYRFQNQTWSSVLKILVRKEVIFIDLVTIAGVDTLLLFERNKVSVLNPGTGQETLLHAVNSIYNLPVDDSLPQIEVSKDLNNDGLEDIAMPDFDGYQILLQKRDGSFTEPALIGSASLMNTTLEDNPWYQPRSMYSADFNQDGLDDLVFWKDNHFEVYAQLVGGIFDPTPQNFTSNVRFSSDGLYSLELGEGAEENNLEQKVLFALDDLNGDGVADLMIFKLEGRSLFGKKSTYEIYHGKPGLDGSIVYSPEAQTEVRSRGIQFDIQKHDFDADGQSDILVLSIDLGLGKIIAALLTGSSSIELGFYRMSEGIYPPTPNVTRKLKVEFDLSTGETFIPSVLVADVTGDGRSDLLIQHGREELRVYEGIAGAELFKRGARKFELEMPDSEDSISLVDLNNDNRKDVMLHFQSSTGLGRLVLMLAR